MYVGLATLHCVAIYDPSTNTEIGRIPLAGGPEDLALSPDNSRLYATSSNNNTVTVIDTATNLQIASIAVGTGPRDIVLNPAGTRAYTSDFNQAQCNGPVGPISIIDTTTNTLVTNLNTTVVAPLGVAINPAGTRVFVAGGCQDISVVDTATNTVVATYDTGNIGFGVFRPAVTPDGTRLYAPIYGVAGADKTEVQVFDTSTGSRVATITVGTRPQGVTIHPTLSRAYVANTGGTLSVIDTSSNSVVASLNLSSQNAYRAAVNRPGTSVYVTNPADNTISIIDVATNALTGTITTGNNTGPLTIVFGG